MRKTVTILLTMLLPLLAVGLAAAVPGASPLEDAVARHKIEYQPEEFDFLLNVGGPARPDAPADDGEDHGLVLEEEDHGLVLEEEDGGLVLEEDDPGLVLEEDDGGDTSGEYDFLGGLPGDDDPGPGEEEAAGEYDFLGNLPGDE